MNVCVNLCVYVCVSLWKGLKNQVQVKMNIVSCPPVTTVLIKRPDLKYQLGFSVQNGIVSRSSLNTLSDSWVSRPSPRGLWSSRGFAQDPRVVHLVGH